MALNKDQFAEQLRHHRALAGLNQSDVAHRVGVELRTYQRWEAGERMPYKGNVRALAEALDVDIEVFTGSLNTSDSLLRIEQAVIENNRLIRQLYAWLASATSAPAQDGGVTPESPPGALGRELQDPQPTAQTPKRARRRAG